MSSVKTYHLNNVFNNSITVDFSPREKECLLWAAKGKTIWETSKILKLSEHTVHEYLKKCITKLNAANKTEAVVKAIIAGIIVINEQNSNYDLMLKLEDYNH